MAQIARTIARQLRLDEDLAETLALAHDLGHPPFGHAGERALDAAMTPYGGFDHNAQSLRVVTRLERKYLDFDGLNLTWESLEGLAKHNGPLAAGKETAVAKAARRLEDWRSLELASWPSAEAQVAALADDIAYLNHDIDDGLRAGFIALKDLDAVPVAREAVESVRTAPCASDGGRNRLVYEITRRMITAMIADVVRESRNRLASVAPGSPDDIRHAQTATIAFSPGMAADLAGLRAFLFARVYRHTRVLRVMEGAMTIVADLFARYHADGSTLPEAWAAASIGLDERRCARLIADFVAGQTDRFALSEHRRLFDATPELR